MWILLDINLFLCECYKILMIIDWFSIWVMNKMYEDIVMLF